MSLLSRALIRPKERALTIDDVGLIMREAAAVGSIYGGAPAATINNPVEVIPGDYMGLVYGIYQANPIAFRAIITRMQVFAQATYRFRQLRSGEPGAMFGKTDLSLLEHPEPGMSTSDLMKRASIHEQLAGNWFGVRRPDRIKSVRPDYCYLVLGSTARGGELGDVDTEVLGLVHVPGGLYSGIEPESFAVGEYAHFAPIPDPIATYRGMSWLTPIIREVQADQLMTVHKQKFLELGATPNVTVKFPPGLGEAKAKEFAEGFEQDHTGAYNAYRTIYLAAGADVQVIGANMQQMDFKAIQGAGETRIAVASGVPAVMLGISEGLQGSSLNAGNYDAAKKSFTDVVMRDLWQDMASSLESIIPPPKGAQLWYDEDQIPILREDIEAAANVIAQKATAMRTLWDGGAEPDSVIEAVTSGDLTRLKHTGQPSVQLQEGAGAPAPTAPAAPSGAPADGAPADATASAMATMLETWGYSPNQPRKSDGKFGHGGGGGGGSGGGGSDGGGSTSDGKFGPGGRGSTAPADGDGPPKGTGGKPVGSVDDISNPPAVPKKVWGKGPPQPPEEAYADLVSGKSPNVHPEDVKEVMRHALEGDSKTADLTDLQVEGTLLFGGDGLGIKRDDMPQFSDVDGNNYLPQFIDHCRTNKGWKVTEGTDVNPAKLKPVQSEVSAKKCAGMYEAMKKGTLPGGDILTSGDDFVIDGHHRWGAGTALSFEQPVVITQTRVHAPVGEVLTEALRWTDEKGIARQSLSTTAKKIAAVLHAVEEYALRHAAPSAVVDLGFATVLEMAMLEVRCPSGHLLAEAATPPYRFTCGKCKAVVVDAGRWAVTTDPKVVVYSPSQPRKSDGKFGTGGTSGGSSGSAEPSAPADTPSSFVPGQKYDPWHPPAPPPGIDVPEAIRRLKTAAPALGEPMVTNPASMRLQGLDRLHPVTRQQLVEGIEMASKASDPRLMPDGIYVRDKVGWTGESEGAYAQGRSIFLKASEYDTTEAPDLYAKNVGGQPYREGVTQKHLPRSAMGAANDAGLSPMHYVAIHEAGHVVEMKSLDGPLARPTRHDADGRFLISDEEKMYGMTRGKLMPPASKYGTNTGDEAERWAEGFVHHVAGLDTPPARYVKERMDGLRGRKMRPAMDGQPAVIPLP